MVRTKKRNGFTLIEVVVVTGVVALLATLGTLSVVKGVRNSRIKKTKSELEMISAAVLQLAWDTGRWPNGQLRTAGGSTEMWNISPISCGLMGTDGKFNNWKGPYYAGAIKDVWGNYYFFDPDYRINGVDRVVVGSFGPNRKGPNLYDTDDIYVLLDD